ncbi:protein kinase domain-containing protein [Subtercola frigoramans]|uniref:non-specific serine/threonine protein kinase n=1 Tax=Subtercola frigoramans TaxID=120298 RepID=A0ABS2L0Z1_9MICO|nr:protein kinase [Subtercola frigoramans]MBM7470738.1 serine/threonine protein kinase [Subtercola frigoramans]
MASLPAPDSTDRVLGGRYRLEHPLGHGGMATVFRARDEALGRDVAIKLFHSSSTDSERQEGELAVLASLDHHALVQMHDAGIEVDGFGRSNRYIVMTLVQGTDLHRRLAPAAPSLSPRHIGEIGYDMAEALDYIHAHNVIHRDIKPSNILLVDYGDGAPRARAKLTDFGIALSDDMERMTAEGATTGTAAYLSPEQASGKPVGPESDVYALGLVLLECFTRKLEYPGSIVESAIARLTRDPVIPDTLSELWQQLLAAMTAREAADRPSRHELVAALKLIVIAESGRHKEESTEPLFPNGEEFGPASPRSGILDTLPDEALDRVTAMAARLFSAPISLVSVVDHDRVWFKSHFGADVEAIAKEVDFTGNHVPSDGPVIIEDCSLDERTKHHPLVTGSFGLRFYIGVPLKRHTGKTIGTLVVLDLVTRAVSPAEVENLEDLAALVVTQLELRQEGMRTTGEIRTSRA